jgi:hypothetical protein
VNRRAWLVVLLLPVAATLRAQRPQQPQQPSFVFLGSVAEDRARMDQLRGLQPSSGWLVRTSSLMSSGRTGGFSLTLPRLCTLEVAAVPVTATTTWNSVIPFARNDGGVWAGRGATVQAAGGVRGRCGRLRAQLIPEVWHARNAHFQVLPSGNPNRSDFANPFHSIPQSSADLPIRLGTLPISTIQRGQTIVSAVIGPIEAGWGT